jgi:DNA-binding beta-propeller fold protein YncE
MTTITRKSRDLAATAILAALLSSTSALAAPFVYIPVGGAGQIEVVDVASGKIVDTYKGLEAVHGLAGTPDGKFLIAGSYTERDRGMAAPAKPKGMSAEDHAAHHAPKADGAAKANTDQISTVSVLRQDTGEIVRAIDVPGAVHHVTVSPDGRFAAVTQPGNDTITAIDLNSYKIIATVNTGALPNYMAFSPDSGLLYVSNAGDNNIAVISTIHWMVKTTLAAGESPEHMVLSKDGKTLFVNNNDDGTVSEIDLASGKTANVFPIGERLHGLDITDDGKALLVAERDGDSVARVDLASGTISKQDMAPAPYHMTSVPGTGLAFVSSSAEPVMRVINQSDLSLVRKIDIPAVGHQMVVSQSR